MLKKISTATLAFILLFTTVTAFADDAHEDIQTQITETYRSALALANRRSFHGNCNLATAYQLQALGIFKNNLDYSGSGNLWYDHYKDISKTSGGYSVITISGKNCLYDLIDRYGSEIYNIVYSMGTGGTSGSTHVMLIRAIIDNMVYFNDSFGCTYGSTYYPEGTCTVLTLEKFIKSYKEMNGDAYGCVYFTNGKSEHFAGSTDDIAASGKYKTGKYIVTAEPTLRIRESAGVNSTVLAAIPCGEIIDVSKILNDWGKTTYNGVTGWVSLDYTEALDDREDGLRIDSVKADKTAVSIGDTVTWTAKANSGSDDIYYYAFIVMKEDTEIYTAPLSASNSMSYTMEEAGIYRVLVTATDADNNKAELYSDDLICIDTSFIIKGDIDGNGKINASDARLALRSAAGLAALTAEEKYAADFDNDGKVTAADARHILRYAAGLER